MRTCLTSTSLAPAPSLFHTCLHTVCDKSSLPHRPVSHLVPCNLVPPLFLPSRCIRPLPTLVPPSSPFLTENTILLLSQCISPRPVSHCSHMCGSVARIVITLWIAHTVCVAGIVSVALVVRAFPTARFLRVVIITRVVRVEVGGQNARVPICQQ